MFWSAAARRRPLSIFPFKMRIAWLGLRCFSGPPNSSSTSISCSRKKQSGAGPPHSKLPSPVRHFCGESKGMLLLTVHIDAAEDDLRNLRSGIEFH